MAKIVVIKEQGGDRVPFLRGIMVQSLLSAGLSFKDACDTALAVRKGLSNDAVITTTELRARVAKHPPHEVPTLDYSSFDAWRGLPGTKVRDGHRKTDNPVIAGFWLSIPMLNWPWRQPLHAR